MRLLILLSVLFAFWGCTSQPIPKPIIAKGEVRFLEDKKELKGELYFFRGDSLANSIVFRPTPGTVAFVGSAMQADELSTRQRWRAEMKTVFPEELRFTFPVTEAEDAEKFTLPLQFSPPFNDSIPALIDHTKVLRFVAGTQPLQKNENVIVFFEPADRNLAPHRIVVAGPTSTPRITLPVNAMEDVPLGQNQVYLVKQQLARDTLDNVQWAIQLAYHTRLKKVVVE